MPTITVSFIIQTSGELSEVLSSQSQVGSLIDSPGRSQKPLCYSHHPEIFMLENAVNCTVFADQFGTRCAVCTLLLLSSHVTSLG
ncbi:hypothetical protein JMJ77_0006074 [Colletotrichum scovillei]|uniref:Uncharacterized protein n=1 Tax=Colletotrichum scovillei TaxID=1209932 RepID=A0A9P7RIJ4_9PEZI|nr:hypothetical protein JMJ77_0006074 [Colletotrichum scovillei]KAG7077277.1 hypothetical protein JMJ76_0014526 [Colletotrichum scovillei]KAG7084415.1 hypothetical protein JMJ78_0009851 [Colletotrichum scovillei]